MNSPGYHITRFLIILIVMPLFILTPACLKCFSLLYQPNFNTLQIDDSATFRRLPVQSKVVSLDTMPAPRRVLAGKPRVVPFNDATFKIGSPQVVNIAKSPGIIVPGENDIPVPKTYKTASEKFRFVYPESIEALPPNLTYGAQGYVKHYSKMQGLDGLRLHGLVMDKNEILWMAFSGLVKFDGSHFTHFTHVENENERVALNLSSLFEDSEGQLWFARRWYENGRIFNYDGNDVYELKVAGEDVSSKLFNYNNIFEDHLGNFWFSTDNNGVLKYEPGGLAFPGGRFVHFTKDCGLPENKVNCIAEGLQGNIWFGMENAGLCKYEPASAAYPYGRLTQYTTANGLGHNCVKSIVAATDGRLWIGTYGGGMNIFDGLSFTHLTEDDGLCHNLVNLLYEDRSGNIWIATQGGGVCKFQLGKTPAVFGSFTSFNSKNILSDYILSMVEDDNGCFWFGSFGSTLSVYNPNSFHHITPRAGMEFEYLRSPVEDEKGNIWFGEERGGGLCKFDGDKFHYYTRQEGLSCDSITALLYDSKNNLWLGSTGGGISKFDGSYFTHIAKRNGLCSNFISCMIEDSDGNIWAGSDDNGISKLEDDRIINYSKNEGLCDSTVCYLMEDSEKNLWIATPKGGVDRFDGTHFVNFKTKYGFEDNQCVNNVIEDQQGNVWFGASRTGPIRYDADATDSSMRFINFKQKHGYMSSQNKQQYRVLNDASAKVLIEGKNGDFWLGTTGGLHLLSFPSENIQEIKVFDFTILDGRKAEDIVVNTGLITSDNRFYYGQGYSLVYIDHDKFKPPSARPQLKLTGIDLEQTHIDYRKLDERIKGGNDYLIGANKNISLSKVKFSAVGANCNLPGGLQLPYHINHLTFHFSAIDWAAPHKLLYRYKLEGSDRDWRLITKETKAVYTGLKHGDYTFKVKAYGAAGEWSETLEYPFTVRPPWWYSWWAYVLYSLLLIALLYAWRRYDLKRQRLKLDLEAEHLHAEKLTELDKMKSRFFANISHEFRTPLTLILGPLQSIRAKIADVQITKDMDIMDRNARRLQTLIDQLLNLSKLESGKMKLLAREENLVSLVRLFIQSFESYAAQRDIRLKFSCKEDVINTFVDREKIEKILNNLLSNAFKFTAGGGEIEVEVASWKTEESNPQSLVSSTQTTVSRPQSASDNKMSANQNLKTVDCRLPIVDGQLKTVAPKGRWVLIRVSDNGSGIAPEKLPHIFERFYQAGDAYSKDQEGSGIGLALVKELVKVHYGEIAVESLRGKGTIFTILMPLGKEHLKPDEIFETKGSAGRKPAEGKPDLPPWAVQDVLSSDTGIDDELENMLTPIVLIVDDNADLRAYIRGFLDGDYHVVEAEDGVNGLAKATKFIPDLIISDVMMPNMDGYQFCHRLKTSELTNHIPVILLTARASFESKIEGLETGADDFITKPFEPQELQVRVKNLILQRLLLRERYKKEADPEKFPASPALSPIDQKFLDRAKRAVAQRMSDPEFNVEGLAVEVGVSRVQLHRKLKAVIDQPASEFIRSLRLVHGAELLLQDAGNVSEVAYDVGFNNPSYFTSSFSKHFGMSPSEYLDRHGKGK
jgi:signal transduction histidine kinase/DNA-binding response OmpR family regulator/ligand-binding sensor domain-containing protein